MSWDLWAWRCPSVSEVPEATDDTRLRAHSDWKKVSFLLLPVPRSEPTPRGWPISQLRSCPLSFCARPRFYSFRLLQARPTCQRSQLHFQSPESKKAADARYLIKIYHWLSQASFLNAFPANSGSKNADYIFEYFSWVLSFLLEFLSFLLSLCSGSIGSMYTWPTQRRPYGWLLWQQVA